MFRISFRLTHEPTPIRGIAFYVPVWRVVRAWPLRPCNLAQTKPISVRHHGGWGMRLLLLTEQSVEPGSVISPYDVLQRDLTPRAPQTTSPTSQ